MILSPMGAYDAWKYNVTCLKPKNNSTTQWIESMAWMIEHPVERAIMAEKAYEQVVRENDIKHWIYERADQYQEIYDRVRGGKK
jgi:hypothetical protein